MNTNFEICKKNWQLNLNGIVLFNHPVFWQESRSTNERIYKIFGDILQICWFSTFAQKSDIFTQMEFNLLLDKKNSFNFMEWTFPFRTLQEKGKNWNIAKKCYIGSILNRPNQICKGDCNLEVVHRILLELSCEMYYGSLGSGRITQKVVLWFDNLMMGFEKFPKNWNPAMANWSTYHIWQRF